MDLQQLEIQGSLQKVEHLGIHLHKPENDARIGKVNVNKLMPYIKHYMKRMMEKYNFNIDYDKMIIMNNGDIKFDKIYEKEWDSMAGNFAYYCNRCISDRIIVNEGIVRHRPLQFQYNDMKRTVKITMMGCIEKGIKNALYILENPYIYGHSTN